MRVGAVIAEYNPFHNGHAYQLDEFRKSCELDYIIVVMSGNFVQRGEPAICEKRERAYWALCNGADMVIELPVYYACANANAFAGGAVGTIAGIADVLGFGAENDSKDLLEAAAKIDLSDCRIKSSGKNYPRELYEWVDKNYGKEIAKVFCEPNSTLALEYIRARNRICPEMDIHITKRLGAMHDSSDISGTFASATALRRMIVSGNDISRYVPNLVEIGKFLTIYDFEKLILYKLRIMSANELKQIAGVSEGLENLFLREAYRCTSLESLLCAVKSKRYTMARLKRICICALLGITENMVYSEPHFIHILGVREGSRNELMAHISAKTKLKIIAKSKDYKKYTGFFEIMLNLNVASTNIYTLFYDEFPNSDYTNKLLNY